MKKFLSAAIKAALVAAFAACCCSAWGCGSYARYFNSSAYLSGGAEISDNVTELCIDWLSGDIDVSAGDGGKLVFSEEKTGVSAENADGDLAVRYLLDGSVLKIKFAKSGALIPTGFGKKLTVILPRGFAPDKITAENVSGNVYITDVRCAELEVKTVSGDVAITRAALSRSLEADSVSGKVSFDGETPCADIDTTSGDVNLAFAFNPRELEVKTVSGETTLIFYAQPDFKIEFSSVSGKFTGETEYTDSGKYKIFGSGAYEYETESTSGGVTVKRG